MPPVGPQLWPREWQHFKALLKQFLGLFSTMPGQTSKIQHAILTSPGRWVQAPLWLLPWKCWDQIEQELQDVLHLGSIEQAQGP